MRDEEGVTAMHYAARYNQYEIVKILQSYGAGNKSQPVQDHQNQTSNFKNVMLLSIMTQKCTAIFHNAYTKKNYKLYHIHVENIDMVRSLS